MNKRHIYYIIFRYYYIVKSLGYERTRQQMFKRKILSTGSLKLLIYK